jgi:hypothetical protein
MINPNKNKNKNKGQTPPFIYSENKTINIIFSTFVISYLFKK